MTDLVREEYTGESRCWPCTIVNLLVLIIVCVVLSIVSVIASIALAIFGCLVIWLRGYLVPYTPQVGPRLSALLPWNPFHIEHESDTLADTSATDGEVVLESLVEEEIVRLDGERLSLDAEFEERWSGEMEALRSLPTEELATATLQVAPSTSKVDVVTREDRAYLILSDGSGNPKAESWLRQPVAIGETAAARVLAEYEISPNHRAVAAHMLGLFLTICPACEGEVSEQPSGGCCGPPRTGPSGEPLQALVCTDCGVQLHVFE